MQAKPAWRLAVSTILILRHSHLSLQRWQDEGQCPDPLLGHHQTKREEADEA